VMTPMDSREHLKREAHEWVARLTSGRATTADAEAAKLWCDQSLAHAKAFAEATQLWDRLEPVARQMSSRNATAAVVAPRAVLGRRTVLAGGLAASSAAVGYLAMRPPLALWPSLQDVTADYRTGTGGRRHVAVDDGISVELNTRTSLNIQPGTGNSPAIELVSGEAAIATGGTLAKPLIVSAGGGRVIATEAKFNVRCDGASASVTCLQGAVTVDYREHSTMLDEGQQVTYDKSGLGSVAVIDPIAVTAWREGRLVFQGVPLVRVIDEVNRYRPGRIILMNAALGRRPVDATFPLDRTEQLVILVRRAYGATVTALPGGVIFLS
jgi:transmembrane sensor